MPRSNCKGCGKEIFWGTTWDGKSIPLDPRAPVYSAVKPWDASSCIVRTELAMVSHFATCPNANDFSASNRVKECQETGEKREGAES